MRGVRIAVIIFIALLLGSGNSSAKGGNKEKTGFLVGALFACKTPEASALSQELMGKQEMDKLFELESSGKCVRPPTGLEVTVGGDGTTKNVAGHLPFKVVQTGEKFWIITDGIVYTKKKALEPYAAAAEKEGVEGEYNLGSRLMTGDEYLARDYREGAKWLSKAVRHGHVEAMYNLGIAYRYGHGVPENRRKAFYYINLAAEAGVPNAPFYLGYLYMEGIGVRKNHSLGIQWYEKAAMGGDIRAMVNLSVAYYDSAEYANAGKWARMAADRGDPNGREALAIALLVLGRGEESDAVYAEIMRKEGGNAETMDSIRKDLSEYIAQDGKYATQAKATLEKYFPHK